MRLCAPEPIEGIDFTELFTQLERVYDPRTKGIGGVTLDFSYDPSAEGDMPELLDPDYAAIREALGFTTGTLATRMAERLGDSLSFITIDITPKNRLNRKDPRILPVFDADAFAYSSYPDTYVVGDVDCINPEAFAQALGHTAEEVELESGLLYATTGPTARIIPDEVNFKTRIMISGMRASD